MNIIIQGVSDHSVTHEQIEEKIGGLSRHFSFIKDMVVEFGQDHHHRKGNVSSVELTAHLFCHGNIPLRSSETASDIHAALDKSVGTMKHLLSVHKDKEEHVDRDAIRAARGK